MKLFTLINPSDPYTFKANSIEIAGVCACWLSPSFGAECMEGDRETTPIIFGWDEWLDDRGIDSAWMKEHALEIADALDSFLIGDANFRADVESIMEMLPEEKQQEWRDKWQERQRTSMNQVGERAYALAWQLRANVEAEGAKSDG